MVVDDGQDLCLVQTGDGLAGFVVVHQNHALTAGPQQVVAVHHTHDLFIGVQNGVTGFFVLQHFFLCKFHPVIGVEHSDIFGTADPSDGGGLENQPGCPVCIKGSGDDAGLGGQIPQFLGQFRFAQHQAVHVHLQGLADQIRLMTAQDDGIRILEQGSILILGQRNDHIAADGIGGLAGLVQNGTLQHGQHIEQGNFLQIALGDQAHVVSSHIVTGQDAVEGSILIGHRQGIEFLLLHDVPGMTHRHRGAQHRGLQEVQIPDLVVHIVDASGRLEAEALQHSFCFIGGFAQTYCFIFPVAAGIPQSRIGQRCNDGVCIGIAMSGYINRIHKATSLID